MASHIELENGFIAQAVAGSMESAIGQILSLAKY